jgi:uncharacterized membrane-anchored protein YhcB (DUF1043 family)
MATRTGTAIRILAAGIAIILIIRYGFKTAREQTKAENKIVAMQAQLRRTQAKLAEANAQTAKLEAYTEELVSLLASMPKTAKQSKKSVDIENKRARPAPPKARSGLITAILYTNSGSSVVIDGKILYEGDTIHGVKVVKIHEDSVELARNTNRWTQRIHQIPPKAWNQNKK